MDNIGARRLHTIVEKVFEDVGFNAPEMVRLFIVMTCVEFRDSILSVSFDM